MDIRYFSRKLAAPAVAMAAGMSVMTLTAQEAPPVAPPVTPANPYLSIVERNAFALKEKPAPPPPKQDKKDEEIDADDLDIIISGFGLRRGQKVVYFKVPDEENKGKFKYYTVNVADKGPNPIDVLKLSDESIDIQYKGGNYTLKLADVRNKPTKSAPKTAANRTTNPNNNNSGRTNINNAPNNRTPSNVTVTRGVATVGGASNRPGVSGAGNNFSQAGMRSVNGNVQVLPSRTVRIGGDAQGGPQMTPEEQMIIIEANSQAQQALDGIPMPPTPGLPSTTLDIPLDQF